MAAAIPMIAAFASGAVGAVMAGTATIGAYLTVAGAALSVVGAVGGNKNLSRLGAIMSLGGGLANMANAGEAAAAEEAARQSAQEGFRASEYADAANAGAASGAEAAMPTTAGLEQATASAQQAGVASESIDPLQRANEAFEAEQQAASAFDRGELAGDSLYGKATVGSQVQPGTQVGNAPAAGTSGVDPNAGMTQQPANPIEQYASRTTADQIRATNVGDAKRVAMSLGDVGSWMSKNKELVSVGGKLISGLASGYQQGQDRAWNQSLYERRMRNMNSPIAMLGRRAGVTG